VIDDKILLELKAKRVITKEDYLPDTKILAGNSPKAWNHYKL